MKMYYLQQYLNPLLRGCKDPLSLLLVVLMMYRPPTEPPLGYQQAGYRRVNIHVYTHSHPASIMLPQGLIIIDMFQLTQHKLSLFKGLEITRFLNNFPQNIKEPILNCLVLVSSRVRFISCCDILMHIDQVVQTSSI